MTTLVKYHHKTYEIALFESDGCYWIGSYSPNLTHQNGEPNYYNLGIEISSLDDGINLLGELTGNEF